MAGDDLSKRTPGAPLSEAELRQRREAARARWAAVGAGVAGAAAGGYLGHRAVQRLQAMGDEVKAQTVGAEQARHARVTAAIDRRADAANRAISRGWPVDLYRKVLAHDAHTARRGLRTMPAEFVNFDMDGKPIFAPIDQERAAGLAQRIAQAQGEIDALKDAKPPRRVEQRATAAKVPKAHERKVKARVKPDGPAVQRAQARLDQARQIYDEMRRATNDPYDGALMEAEREVARAERRLERTTRGKGAVKSVAVGANRPTHATERTVVRHATKRRLQGVPDDKGLARIRDTLRGRVRDVQQDRLLREFNRHGQLRAAAEARWKAAQRWVPGQRGRLALIGAGAAAGGVGLALVPQGVERGIALVAGEPATDAQREKRHNAGQAAQAGLASAVAAAAAGRAGQIYGGRLGRVVGRSGWKVGRVLGAGLGAGLAGWGAWRALRPAEKMEKLAKAADDLPRDPADELLEAGGLAEEGVAQRIARVFRYLREAPAGELLQPGADLIADIQRGLRDATKPIAEAMARGARTAPIGAEVATDEPMTLAFTFDARNPRVANYIREYREQRVRELTEEQADTIRNTVLEQALTGASPDDIARQVRQSIGLTAAQAAQVRAFRAQLEALDPKALGRALRDKRFDRTVARAIQTGSPLSAEQVDKMVDAYHRRYLAYRATTIARTEGVGAANNGHVMAMREWLVQNPNYTVVKTWIATKDERTRPDHRALHGQAVVGIDTAFTAPNGDQIRWPGDQEAPARQLVNCRCSLSTRIIPRVRSLVADGGEA